LLSANTAHIQSIIDAERRELQLMLDEEEDSVRAAVSFIQCHVYCVIVTTELFLSNGN